ncbi:MAG: DUF4336 domain-containing protein [Cyanobacteria bacterium P01_D01_bin.1]
MTLQQLDRDLWAAEQPLRYMGLNIRARMTVVRSLLSTESPQVVLTVVSPIEMTESLRGQLNQLGPVANIIAPNCYHHFFVADFKALYPQATFWAAPGLAVKKPELPIDKTIDKEKAEFVPGLVSIFFNGLMTLGFDGIEPFNECVFFHAASRTLILTDAAFHLDSSFPWLTQLVARVIGSYQRLSPSLLEKIATVDKTPVKQAVQQILDWDFDRVVMAHGSIIETDGKEAFRKGYEKFFS